MTEVATVSASCRTISNADSKGPAGPLFVLVHWHEDSKLFDTWITDCSDAWSATGCTVAYQAMDAEAAWKRTKEALGDEVAAATQYSYSARRPIRGPEQQLELTWSWQRSNSGVREMMRVTPLLQQQDTSSTTRLIMTHIMASYTAMKAAMDESRKAQLLLERSLKERQQQLQQKTQEWQGKEQALFTKFAMLLNKKSERIQALTDTVQRQAQQLEQLQGEEEHNTDDEALAGVYSAETEDDEPDEPAQQQQQEQQQQEDNLHPQLRAVKQEQPPMKQEPPNQQEPRQLLQASDKVGAGEPAAAAAAAAVDGMDVNQATQPLDEDAQAALELQRQQYLQQQRRADGGLRASESTEATLQVAEGAGGVTGLAAPAAAAAGGSTAAVTAQQQQQPETVPAGAAQHKPKGFKRRR